MPRGDRTGRNGFGPMTGRGLGYCAGFDTPGYLQGAGFGRGRFGGRGLGLGFGRMAVLADAPRELDILDERAMVLEQQLADVKKRLETLQKEDRS